MSLFSRITPAEGKTSIFGNNQASSQPQQSSSTSAASIFANLGNQQQPQPTQGGLFQNLGTSQAQQSQPAQSSLFANLGSSQPQQKPSFPTSSLFGAAQPAASQPASTSLLAPQPSNNAAGSSLFASQKPQQTDQPAQETQQPTASTRLSQPAYFDSLLEKGKKRNWDADGGSGLGQLPELQLGLGDIARRVRDIGGVGTQTSAERAADSKAHYLLAASGVNLGTTRRDLDSLKVQPGAATSGLNVPAEWDIDNNRYVDQMQQQSTLKMISEGIERAHRNFDAYLDENIDINWEAQRKRIYEHFNLVPCGEERSNAASQLMSPGGRGSFGRSTRRVRATNAEQSKQSTLGRSIFGQSSLQKSVIGTPNGDTKGASVFSDVEDRNGQGAVSEDRFSRDKQTKFAVKVQALNRTRLQERPYPIFNEFKDVQMQPGGEVSELLPSLLDGY